MATEVAALTATSPTLTHLTGNTAYVSQSSKPSNVASADKSRPLAVNWEAFQRQQPRQIAGVITVDTSPPTQPAWSVEATVLQDEASVATMATPLASVEATAALSFSEETISTVPLSTKNDPSELPTFAIDELNDSPRMAIETRPQPMLISQDAGAADDIRWRFSFTPAAYVPFGANGGVSINGIDIPVNADISDIFDAVINTLNFAAFGEFEAWKGPWGFNFNGSYLNAGSAQSATVTLPDDPSFPPNATINAAAGISFTRLDFAGAYRFGDGNLPNALQTAETEFDLGLFIFDAFGGARVYFFNTEAEISSDLNFGLGREISNSYTVVEPMIGGRARWNLSPNMAAIARADISGFGIGGLTFSATGQAGIDWLVSGNTSLLALYRFSYVDYEIDGGDNALDLFTHGPVLGVKFRF